MLVQLYVVYIFTTKSCFPYIAARKSAIALKIPKIAKVIQLLTIVHCRTLYSYVYALSNPEINRVEMLLQTKLSVELS